MAFAPSKTQTISVKPKTYNKIYTMTEKQKNAQRTKEDEENCLDEPIDDMQVDMDPALVRYQREQQKKKRSQAKGKNDDLDQDFQAPNKQSGSQTGRGSPTKTMQPTSSSVSVQQTTDRLHAYQAKREAKLKKAREDREFEETQRVKNGPILVSSQSKRQINTVPIHLRVDTILQKKQQMLEKKQDAIDKEKRQKMQEQGIMTDEEILEMKAQKEYEAQQRQQERGENFEEKYQRQMVERKYKEMMRQVQKAELEKGTHTFKPQTSTKKEEDSFDSDELPMQKQKKKKNTGQDLIGIPCKNRVEDRLIEHGKSVHDKKNLHRELNVPTFKPQLNLKSMAIASGSLKPNQAMTTKVSKAQLDNLKNTKSQAQLPASQSQKQNDLYQLMVAGDNK